MSTTVFDVGVSVGVGAGVAVGDGLVVAFGVGDGEAVVIGEGDDVVVGVGVGVGDVESLLRYGGINIAPTSTTVINTTTAVTITN